MKAMIETREMIISRKLKQEEVIRTSVAIHRVVSIKYQPQIVVLDEKYTQFLIHELNCINIYDLKFEGEQNGEFIYYVKYLKDLNAI